jgi:DNA invertase Pin-like site-specific DNA recombinase
VKAARARGDTITRWWIETASGGTMARPELTDLQRAAAAGDLSVVYVYRLDRLTRTGIRDTLGLVQELNTLGCQVKSVADGFSLEGPQAEIILAVMAWAAQMERAAINERIASARERVEAQGGAWGRPLRCETEQRDKIVELSKSGLSVRQISQTVHVPKSTVQRLLSRMVSLEASQNDTGKPCPF